MRRESKSPLVNWTSLKSVVSSIHHETDTLDDLPTCWVKRETFIICLLEKQGVSHAVCIALTWGAPRNEYPCSTPRFPSSQPPSERSQISAEFQKTSITTRFVMSFPDISRCVFWWFHTSKPESSPLCELCWSSLGWPPRFSARWISGPPGLWSCCTFWQPIPAAHLPTVAGI